MAISQKFPTKSHGPEWTFFEHRVVKIPVSLGIRNGGDSSSEPPPPSVTTVSRILSGRVSPAWTAISLKDPRRTADPRPSCDGCDVTRGPARPMVGLRSRRPLPLFCLAPHRVFRAPSVALGAVGSYPAFSPLPRSCDRGGLFSVTLSVDRGFRPCLPRILRGMPPCGVRTFLQDCSQRSSAVTTIALGRYGLNATQRQNEE